MISNKIVLRLVVCVCVVACACGCATRRHGYSFIDSGVAGGPVSFSDDVSRALVHQTRELLKLKSQDYLVGPDDVLEISIFEWEMTEETRTLDARVSESGIITLPVLGAVNVANKTVQQIHDIMQNKLLTLGVLQNPRVGVSVKEYRSRRIAVIGAVNAPGVYAIHENVSTLMDILTLAGGPSDGAGQVVYVLRKEKEGAESVRIAVDLEELFDKGNFDLNAVLQGDDIVYAPRAPLVYVYGAVRAPGGFALRRSMRVLEALALAGGFASKADKRGCFLVRRAGKGKEQIVDLNIVAVEKGKQSDFFLQEGDVLRVPESIGKNVLSELWGVFRGIFTFTYRLDE